MQYVGFIFDCGRIPSGLRKVSAIKKSLIDLALLRSYLEFVNYCAEFISQLHDLHALKEELFCKNGAFPWSGQCQFAFNRRGQVFTSSLFLTHLQPDQQRFFVSGAWNCGVRAVVFRRFPNDLEELNCTCFKIPNLIWTKLLSNWAGNNYFWWTGLLKLGIVLLVNLAMQTDFQDYCVNFTKKRLVLQNQVSQAFAEALDSLWVPVEDWATIQGKMLFLAIQYVRKKWLNSLRNSELAFYLSKRSDLLVSNGWLFWNSQTVIRMLLRSREIKNLRTAHLEIWRTKFIVLLLAKN